MPHFNTVLIPPTNVGKAAIDFAQINFAHQHDNYCLGSDGHLPHITLAQTEIADDETLNALYKRMNSIEQQYNDVIEFGEYYHDRERGYCGVSVRLSDTLKKLHLQIVEYHHELGLQIDSGHGENYWPHMTFAKTPVYLSHPVKMPPTLTGTTNDWFLEFGHKGGHGVYLGRYEP